MRLPVGKRLDVLKHIIESGQFEACCEKIDAQVVSQINSFKSFFDESHSQVLNLSKLGRDDASLDRKAANYLPASFFVPQLEQEQASAWRVLIQDIRDFHVIQETKKSLLAADTLKAYLKEWILSFNTSITTFVGIRPNEALPQSNYDVNYWNECQYHSDPYDVIHKDQVNNLIEYGSFPGCFFQAYAGTFQQWLSDIKSTEECARIQKTQIHYFSIDSLYYLSSIDWPTVPRGKIWTTFTEFTNLPGVYNLPGKCGTFLVNPCMVQQKKDDHRRSCATRIFMRTGGNTTGYDHPSIFVRGAERVYNFGHISWNRCAEDTSVFSISVKQSVSTYTTYSSHWAEYSTLQKCVLYKKDDFSEIRTTLDQIQRETKRFMSDMNSTRGHIAQLTKVAISLYPGKMNEVEFHQAGWLATIKKYVPFTSTELKISERIHPENNITRSTFDWNPVEHIELHTLKLPVHYNTMAWVGGKNLDQQVDFGSTTGIICPIPPPIEAKWTEMSNKEKQAAVQEIKLAYRPAPEKKTKAKKVPKNQRTLDLALSTKSKIGQELTRPYYFVKRVTSDQIVCEAACLTSTSVEATRWNQAVCQVLRNWMDANPIIKDSYPVNRGYTRDQTCVDMGFAALKQGQTT